MDVEGVIDALNAALRLQYRSALGYTVIAGSVVGLRFAALAPQLTAFAHADLDDARQLVEKVVTLGGAPLQDCIPLTGQEGRSEALEHRLEHMIMRKQERRDTLARAQGAMTDGI